MIKAIVIDDEELGRNVLKNLVQKYCPEISIVGEASNVKEAKKVISETNPAIVFLDIEMPGGSGFDLLEQLKDHSFSVIFTTAYNQYAVKAFRHSAVDYLLKPINIDELLTAIKKVLNPTGKKAMQSVVEYSVDGSRAVRIQLIADK